MDGQRAVSSQAPRAVSAARSPSVWPDDGLSRPRRRPDPTGRPRRAVRGRPDDARGQPRARSTPPLERFGRLDAIVPNAGFQHVAPVADFPEDRWDALLSLLLTSPFLLAKYAWPALEASGDGRIVVIASAHGLAASPFKAGYVSAKHGVLGLVKTLALEGADQGITRDRGLPRLRAHAARREPDRRSGQAHGMQEERVLEEVILAPHAVKRLIEPDEVADVVVVPAGPGGRPFTGAPGDDGPGLDAPLSPRRSALTLLEARSRRAGARRRDVASARG